MKKAIFFSLFLLLCFSLDASAFHWRLFHHHSGQQMSARPFLQQPGIPLLPFGPGVTPTITVPAEIAQNIKDADKTLREAAKELEPLVKKYKIETSTTASGVVGTSAAPVGPALTSLDPEQRKQLLDEIFKNRKKKR